LTLNPVLHPTRVLVIDDEALIRELVADALHEASFDVQCATNGVAALELLRGWVPDVIVLDLMMPRLDGTRFADLLRLNRRWARIPVLLLTAAYAPLEAAERIGARAVLAKPFELDDLIQMVVELSDVSLASPRSVAGEG
jgi:CheY-like chemotaxis protein